MKNNLLAKVLWVISGILLIITGIICLCNPHVTLVSLSLLFGIMMLIAGIINIIIFARFKDFMFGAGWQLAEGILTILMALFVLGNHYLVSFVLPFIFSIWVLFSGLSKAINSYDLKKFGVRKWAWVLFLGILEMILGALTFMEPITAAVTISVIVGTLFIVRGMSIIFSIFVARDIFHD